MYHEIPNTILNLVSRFWEARDQPQLSLGCKEDRGPGNEVHISPALLFIQRTFFKDLFLGTRLPFTRTKKSDPLLN